MADKTTENDPDSHNVTMKEEAFNYDDILEHTGEMGKFQRRICLLLFIPAFFPGMAVMSNNFTGAIPDYQCYVDGCNTTESFWLNGNSSSTNACYRYNMNVTDAEMRCQHPDPNVDDASLIEKCDKWTFDTSIFTSTIATDFDLTCENENEVALSNSAYMVGMLIGSCVLGTLADIIGRKLAYTIICFVLGVAMTATSFAPNFLTFCALRFVTGIGGMGQFLITYVWGVEATGKKFRVPIGVMYQVLFSTGSCFMGLLAYLVRDWKTLQLIAGIPMFIPLFLYWVVPESTPWLISMKRYDEARKLIEKAAKTNNKVVPEHLLIVPSGDENENSNTGEISTDSQQISSEVEDQKKESLVTILKTPVLCARLLILFIAWIAIVMSFFGISFSAGNLAGDFFLNYELLMFVEIPAHFCSIFSMNKIGRRAVLTGSLFLAGIFCLSTGLVPKDPAVYQIVCSLLGKFFATVSFDTVYSYTTELFPTHSRTFTIGLCSTFGRVGSVIAPIIADLGRKQGPGVPFIIFSIFNFVAGIASITLPETKDLPMPTNIKEAVDLNDHALPCFRCNKKN